MSAVWFKSSYSGSSQDCVEVAHFVSGVGVRDSKNPTGPELTFTPAAWDSFLATARLGKFTRP
ncbi:DUF397 domain-containing protein [Nocardia cyriacigeorgica]|uniref:Domain of uncharacterized function (DUF397) n=1 Tax=Nocardia cyriacigeorgica TaxID=135487 RepID=A0A4U8VVB6_9NOCA|nr:DUF397 domain-containing protein [Nocardia cyriacigeorgica]VFA97252.1 Domain of uncharacterised function (DUF397) [Nocardia cyriacigeorgica]